MLAAKLYGVKDIRLEDVPIPEIESNEILLKVKSTAICGTDVRMFSNGHSQINENNPRIIGHEFGGIIEKVGKNIQYYHEGMRVAVAPNMGCGICDECVSGNTQMCHEYQALGIHLDGGFAEYVKIPEAAIRQGNIIELDSKVTFEEAAINEPLSCVYNGFLACNIRPGSNVLIVGAGPIGLMHAKLAKMAGAAKIMMNDLSAERLTICSRIDDFLITLKSEDLKEQVMDLTHGKGVNVCITACPAPQAQAASLELMAAGGLINFFGGLPSTKEMVTLNTNLIHYKQLVVTGSARASLSQYRTTLRFITDGLIDVKSLVSAQYSLPQIADGFQSAIQANGLKNVINF
jgi:L-iditol 2-dehydrogenase